MKTLLRTIIVASLTMLVIGLSFGQSATVTRIVTIAGDSTTAIINRGTVDYLPNGVIWIAAAEYPVANVGKMVAYISTDHGATWVKKPVYTYPAVGSNSGITGIAAKDGNTAVLCTTTGEILRTSNGGTSWETVSTYSPGEGFCDGIKFVSGDTMVAYGDADASGLYVARSFDAGKTWTRVLNTNANLPGDSLNMPGIYAGFATYGQAMETYGRTVWLSLYNTANDPPSILKSIDAGNTWSWFRVRLPSGPAQNYVINSISFKDENIGFIVGRRAYGTTTAFNNYLCRTTDGGRTWSDTISVEPGVAHNDAKPMTVKAIRGTNTVVAVGFGTVGAKVWISHDAGLTWAPVSTPTPHANADLRNLAFGTTTQGIAIGWYTMAKITLTGMGEQLLGDDFTAAGGTALTSAGWTQSQTTSTNPLTIATPGLTFPGHGGSGVGGAVSMANTGQDVYREFGPVSAGDVYLSFLMNVSAAQATGDYIMALSPSSLQTNYIPRLFIKSSGTGFNVGVSKSNETPQQYGTTVFNFNTTYFVAVKYSFVGTSTDANDPVSVYVVPSGSSIAAEPTPEISSYTNSGKNDATDLGFVTIRQGTATSAPTLVMDAIRVGTDWASVIAAATDLIKVTFTANAATWQDTLSATSGLVQIRGTTLTGASNDDATTDTLSKGTYVDWNAKTSMNLKNIGGDYWQGSFRIKKGTKLAYKFFANAQNKSVKPGDTFEHTGWENNVVDVPGFTSGNRGLDLTNATKDTVLPVQFINGIGHGAMTQFQKPYTAQDSTYALYLRVNMSGWEDFNPANHKIAVRGSNMSDWGQTGELSWGPSYQLKREGSSAFYANVVHVPNKYATAGVKFKFVVHLMGNPLSEDWSAMAFNPNVEYEVPTRGVDSTVQWKWFNNMSPKPSANKDTVIVTYTVNMQQAIAERGFAIGDTLQVRSGYASTASEIRTKTMTRSGITTTYTAKDTLVATVGKLLHYQYYLVKSGTDVREVFYDFDWTGEQGQSERRKLSVTSKNLTINDIASNTTDMRRMPRFRNTSKLKQPVTVTYTVDLRPAYYTIKMAGKKLVSTNITPYTLGNADSVFIWGVWMNGPAVGGWDTRGAWGSARRADTTSKMYDDGTHGDLVKGDSIWSLKYSYTTADFIGQEFKFGIGGFDNEGGFGNNHIENIDDGAATATIASQFGSIDPKFYNAWNFDLKKPQTPTAVEETPIIPLVYALQQNYPNPFNPSTVIRFSIPNDGQVTLKVFNTLGQEVAVVLNQVMKAGQYNIAFDATRLSTGVYFYQINAGKFVDTKKMVLLK